MNRETSIEWTDASWNPIRGCTKVSAGCANCFAERIALRFSSSGLPFHGFADPARAGWTGRVELRAESLAAGLSARGRVFVNSMSDLFHEALSDHAIAAVFGVMLARPLVTWQIVTKRPARAFEFFQRARPEQCSRAAREELLRLKKSLPNERETSWPPRNVHLLASIESKATAADRIPALLGTRAHVIGLSCEPLLEALDLSPWIHELDWIIAGGESGAGARPMHPEWLRSLRDQALGARVPFFFKQWGEWCPVMAETEDSRWLQDDELGPALVAPFGPRKSDVGRILDGRTWSEFPSESGHRRGRRGKPA